MTTPRRRAGSGLRSCSGAPCRRQTRRTTRLPSLSTPSASSSSPSRIGGSAAARMHSAGAVLGAPCSQALAGAVAEDRRPFLFLPFDSLTRSLLSVGREAQFGSELEHRNESRRSLLLIKGGKELCDENVRHVKVAFRLSDESCWITGT